MTATTWPRNGEAEQIHARRPGYNVERRDDWRTRQHSAQVKRNLAARYTQALKQYRKSERRPPFIDFAVEPTEEEFMRLAGRWENETRFMSSIHEAAMHPAYQRIIGMGRPALPLILERLRDRPDHWFWALTAITGFDAASGEETVGAAAQRWLEWGREQGILVD